MKIAASTTGQDASALAVPWNPTTWQHTAEVANAVLSEVSRASAAGNASDELLSAVSALTLVCTHMFQTELAVEAIYRLGWDRAQQQLRERPRKRRTSRTHLHLVR